MEAKIDPPSSEHVEILKGPEAKAVHSERPVWEERETYGKAGMLTFSLLYCPGSAADLNISLRVA